MARPLLDNVELQQVQDIETKQDQVLVQHDVPALEGDFLQRLDRRATQVTLTGVLTGPEVGDGLKALREKFQAAQPVPFVADITTATKVDQVMIEEMGVRELAGKPERFEYAFTLREFITPPSEETEEPPPVPEEPPDPEVATLEVEVIVEGDPNFDFSGTTVTVEGPQEDGPNLSRTLTNRANNIWTEDDFPPGQYTVRAVVSEPSMSGTAQAVVHAGQTTRVTITLHRGQVTNIAKAFVVHFRFDKAFVEPCMRRVLRRVVEYATAHTDEKLLIVGHTDKVGSDAYNLSLGDRRARSVYAYLTFGRDAPARAAALAEWNALLVQRPAGELTSVKDSWGTHQYQYMLQDLGFYPGNVDGDHGPLTTEAVREFQQAHSLAVIGAVDDATWSALTEAYLSQDESVMNLPESKFLPNCPGEILKWISCGEQHPRSSTPRATDPGARCAPTIAWRPNRRVELLFVTVSALPQPELKPVTFDLAPAVGTNWCVGPTNPDPLAPRCTFLVEGCSTPAANQICIEPAEPGTISVSGSIIDENGAPMGNTRYVLIAPDGEFMDGERMCGGDRGNPKPGRTRPDGTFTYTDSTPVGIYTMEVELPSGPHITHVATEPPATGKGSVVCKRLTTGDSHFDVIVRTGAPSSAAVNPIIILASAVVVVKKSYTNPARQLVTLSTSSPLSGSDTGTLARSSAAVHFFTAAVGGTEITFNGTDNIFTSAQLAAGMQLFAEGVNPSAALDDFQLTLTLSSASLTVGPPANATMTAVELTLDVCVSRTAPGIDPVPLSTNDKINVGRFVQTRDPSLSHERTMLIVRTPIPPAFSGTLELSPINAGVQAFTDEMPAADQTPIPNPHAIQTTLLPPNGLRYFTEGLSISSAVRDTGFRLGIQGLENEADRVNITTASLEVTDEPTPTAVVLTFVRFGLWDEAYDATPAPGVANIKPGATEANHFIGADRRNFHIRVNNVNSAGSNSVRVNWRTLRANQMDDDAPVNQAIDLPAISGSFISRSLMLVTDDIDRNLPTESGLAAPLDVGPRAAGQSNHRTRRARIDGFSQVEYSPQAGVLFRITLPLFNRAIPFNTTCATAVAAGVQTITPAAMSATVQGVRWTIRVGSNLIIDTGNEQEPLTVIAATSTTFTANFIRSHTAGFPIAGTVDERRRLRPRVLRYTQAGVPLVDPAYIAAQFQNANLRWNNVGLQIDPVMIDPPRPAPVGALLPIPGPPPETVFAGGPDSAQEQAALNDLIPVTPDNTLTVVFVPIDTHGFANAYATVFPRATVALGDRFFIFIDENINLEDYTLAHELHHVLFNRGDVTVPPRFFTFNTEFAPDVAAHAGLALPNVRLNRRLHTVNSPNPDNDNLNVNTLNWFRRRRTARFPIGAPPLSAATATTGNTLVEDFT